MVSYWLYDCMWIQPIATSMSCKHTKFKYLSIRQKHMDFCELKFDFQSLLVRGIYPENASFVSWIINAPLREDSSIES